MFGVTANNDTTKVSTKSGRGIIGKELQKESITPLPFLLMIISFQKL
jgi:hypothetical protein